MLAIPIVALLPLTVLLHRAEMLDFQFGIAILAFSVIISSAIFICSSITIINRKPCRFSQNVRKTLFISGIPPALVIGFIIYMSIIDAPPIIHDISTDTVNTLQFDQAVTLRSTNSNSLAINPDVIAQQYAAYPSIKTLHSHLDYSSAFNHAIETAQALGWTVHHIDQTNGLIEAYEKTKIWGFIDDVIIRIQKNDNESLVDIRSVSRVGKGDLGANAARIKRFFTAYKAS